MGKIAKLFLCVVVLFMAATAGAYAAFGVKGLGGLLLLCIVGYSIGKRMLAKFVKKLFLMPFQAKGAVLHNAAAVVHSIRPAAAPESKNEDSLDENQSEAREWYLIDVTITPDSNRKMQEGCGFTMWDPTELGLAKAGITPEQITDPEGQSDETCLVESCKIWNGSEFVSPDDAYHEETNEDAAQVASAPHHDDVRLQLHVGALPGTRDLVFQYYFEVFGSVTLPQTGQGSPRVRLSQAQQPAEVEAPVH